MYQVDGFLKFVEEDNYNEGCNPDTAYTSEVNIILRDDSIDGLLTKVAEFLGVKLGDIDKNACDEPGRIDIGITENGDGYKASDSEMGLEIG